MNKLVKRAGDSYGGRGDCSCQGWGSILLGAEVHSPNFWWNFAAKLEWLLLSSSSSSQGSPVLPGHFPNQCGGRTSAHVQQYHFCCEWYCGTEEVLLLRAPFMQTLCPFQTSVTLPTHSAIAPSTSVTNTRNSSCTILVFNCTLQLIK